MSIPYLPLYVTDYEADTAHLSVAEDGAYTRLLRLCWRTPGCTIPADHAWVQRRVRASDDEWQAVYLPVLAEFFKVRNARIYSPRLLVEYQRICATSNARSAAGKKGGRPRKALKTNETTESPAKANEKHLDLDPDLDKKESAYALSASAFDAFCAVYPNRKEKAGAKRKFAAAVKAGTDPARIIEGARRYAQSDAVRRGFAKHPTTWLNNGCWDDEPDQPTEPSPARSTEDERFARLMDFARRRDQRREAEQRMADGPGADPSAPLLGSPHERGRGNDDDGGLVGCAGPSAAGSDRDGHSWVDPLPFPAPAYAWGGSGAR